MKKLLLSFLFLLHASLGFSQLVEGFENTTGITGPLPATWTLNSGNWTVFENNTPSTAGTNQSWGINAFANGLQFEGNQCASVSRENVGAGNASEDYLVTPPVTIPLNGQLHFYTRMFTSGDQGTIYKIMVAPALLGMPAPTDPTSFTHVTQWTENELIAPASNYDTWTEKIVDLSDYAGLGVDVYIAFVRVYTQPDGNINGDRWLIDNVNLLSNPCVISASAAYLSSTSIQLNWTSTSTEPMEVMILPCDNSTPLPADSGIIATGNSYIFSNLILGNCYKTYVKNTCSGAITWTEVNVAYGLASIQLIPFFDINNNGIKDANEHYCSFGHFGVTTNNSTQYFSYGTVHAFIPNLITDVFDFEYLFSSSENCFTVGSTSYNDVHASFQAQVFYFPVTITPSCFDHQVVLIPDRRPVPNTIDRDFITLSSNYSTIVQPITLVYTKSPGVSIASVVPSTGIVFTPTGFTYNHSGLTPFTNIFLTVNNTIPPIPTVNLGDILTSSVSISSNPTDTNPLNNISTISQIVSASYDPNDINESHGPKIQFDQFSQNDYLYYTIRFQNTGNANAIRVRVDNVLDSKIDENSIEMIAARHDHIMVRRENTVSWEFNNIQLPPASVNEDLSNGFITFRVKLKPGFAIGDVIPATASIYFDSNPAIVTETFNTEFVELLGNPTFDNDSVSLYPNPAKSSIKVTQAGNDGIKQLDFYDVAGKLVKRVWNVMGQTPIDISALAKGIYFVEITSTTDTKSVKKLIIQ